MKKLITKEQIAARIKEVAKEIGPCDVMVAIMKGALLFAADLLRELDPQVEFDYIRCQSYQGTERGELTIEGNLDFAGKDVLIVDDICDSGETLSQVVQSIKAKSIHTIALLRKGSLYRPDFVLFDVPDCFVVGYGLDHDEKYRGFPDIYAM